MDKDSAGVRVELLPCPFCGAQDEKRIQAYTRLSETFAYWSVECLECGFEIADDESQASANQRWNTRATPSPAPAVAEENESLREALEAVAMHGKPNCRGTAAQKLASAVSYAEHALAAIRANGGEG